MHPGFDARPSAPTSGPQLPRDVDDSQDDDAKQEWIADVVSAFSQEHSLREKFCQAAGGQAWEETI